MAVPIVPLSDADAMQVGLYGALGAMLKWQDVMSTYCGVQNFDEYNRLRNNTVALAVEANEVLAHFSNETKPWKQLMPNMELVDEEMIDVLHFVLTYFNLRGWDTKDILEHYRSKNLHNFDRVRQKMEAMQNA